MNKVLPIIAIVGQPNVGKSTLLNKIAGTPLAVTSSVAGTTRDRQYLDTAWNGMAFTLVDTAGLSLDTDSELEHSLNRQIDIAVTEADVVMLVVDGKEGVEALGTPALKKFRNLKKPIVLVVNKMDSPKNADEKMAGFRRLGLKDIFAISSVSGKGIGDLLDHVASLARAKKAELSEPVASPARAADIAVAIVGKPNVGKSSIFNAILKEERVVVSPVPGTTRTAIDSHLRIGERDYTFIDTAGLKKKTYRQEQPDVYAGFQTFKSIRRSDVCFFVVDAIAELTKQDQRVASEIAAMDKGVIILVNKTDMFEGDQQKMRDYVSMHFPFLWMSPLFFVSGKTGQGLDEALAAIEPIFERRTKTLGDDVLGIFLAKKLKANPPKLLRDQKNPKVFSLRQVDTNPPMFELLVNHPAAISQQFRKYLENSIIKELDFWGTPIKLRLKAKP